MSHNKTAAAEHLRIAVDACGGSGGHDTVLKGGSLFLEKDPNAELLLFGDQELLTTLLPQYFSPSSCQRLGLRHAAQMISEEERLISSLRRKTSSSIHGIVEACATGEAAACVSSGNSGALAAVARLRLGMLPGVERPAFCCRLPHDTGWSYFLDVGACVDIPAHRFVQLALLGEALAIANGCERARVALLNIGSEIGKGNRQIISAHRLFSEAPLNYIGFIEACQLFSGDADVIVCDGFIGNIALKSVEGAADHVLRHLHPVLEEGSVHLKNILDPRSYNGALLLGLQGTVVKSHGRSDAQAFFHSLQFAAEQVRSRVPVFLQKRFGQKAILEAAENISAASL